MWFKPRTRMLIASVARQIGMGLTILFAIAVIIILGILKPAAQRDCTRACQEAGYDRGEFTGACEGDDCQCLNQTEKVPRP